MRASPPSSLGDDRRPSKLVAKPQQASGIDFRLHDLRRTARTLMSRLDVAEDIPELAIGHVRADLIARYNKDEAWDGRVDAFTKVSAHVAALIGARDGDWVWETAPMELRERFKRDRFWRLESTRLCACANDLTCCSPRTTGHGQGRA